MKKDEAYHVTFSHFLYINIYQYVYLRYDNCIVVYWLTSSPGFVNYTKGWTRLAAASDKDYQLIAYDR